VPAIQQILRPDGSLAGEPPPLAPARLRELLVHMQGVRCTDERMLKLQRAGRVGFVGTATGLEAAIIGSAAALEPRDWLWSGLREGGAAVMRGLPLDEYVAQMYCNANDTAKGRQMCNHFQHKGSNYPSWSSVIGTQITHGVGAAYASKLRGEDVVHALYHGDGSTSSNGFHSGMNFAGVWKVPAVFVCIDNGWAISVPSSEQSACESLADKGLAYGIPGVDVDGNDVLAVWDETRAAVERARAGGGPTLVVLKSYRMLGHSSSDDPSKYRAQEEVDSWAARDPIARFERHLIENGVIAEGELKTIEAELLAELDRVIHEQEAAPPMPLKTLVEDVYAEVPRHLKQQYNDFVKVAKKHGDAQPGDGAFPL
jgi:TPP-dependent pyruvate/acetoin dehydrogenase alpha subunit